MPGTQQAGKPLKAKQSSLPCLIDAVHALVQGMTPALRSLERKESS